MHFAYRVGGTRHAKCHTLGRPRGGVVIVFPVIVPFFGHDPIGWPAEEPAFMDEQSPHLMIDATRAIPADELEAKASRAGGAGGQHVNTSSTRVEVSWIPARSRILSAGEAARVSLKLASRLDSAGVLRVVASDTRSQRQNRELAESRLAALVRQALVVPKARKKTKPSRGAKRARLEDKRRESSKKAQRRSRDWE